MSGRLIVMCRHAGEESDHFDAGSTHMLSHNHSLGRKLIDLMDQRNLKYTCIITSSLDRAKETGAILKSHLHIPCLVDSHLDEYYPNDSNGFLRILMAIWNAFEMSSSNETMVLVTHSSVLHRCARLFAKIPFKGKFHCTPCASMSIYEFPFAITSEIGVANHSMWYCETGCMFRQKCEWVSGMVGIVDRMWDNAPVPNVGPVEVFLDSDDWLVETDVWAMNKWRVKSTIIMAITKIKMDGVSTLLRCLRDLMPEHVDALKTLDEMYPDSKWVKYIVYPPFVWRLHVHIQGMDAPLPYKNVYLLKDVIHSLEVSKGSQDYLVWKY